MANGEPGNRAAARARELLTKLRGRALRGAELAPVAAELAALLWQAAEVEKTQRDRLEGRLLGRLMDDRAGQAFTSLLADRAFRSRSAHRVVAEVLHLLASLGTPRYLPVRERLALDGVRAVGPALPTLVARTTLERLRERTRSVIIDAGEAELSHHLARRQEEGVRLNLNWLGEAVLGEAEAERRAERYVALLLRPDVGAISVKISTLTSQLDRLAIEATLDRLRPRLRALYRVARAERFVHADGRVTPKLVNLDMEAYRDLELTVALFRSVLEEAEFLDYQAGIALQAYLPDSFPLQRALTDWALARVAGGGAPIRLRIVKGANLAAERVESSHRGWELPVYATKAEVDANAKRMIDFGCENSRLCGVELGIASHNVFDLAFGMVLAASRGVERGLSFELLEGMADPLRRVVQQVAGDVLLYAPVVDERSMQPAIAYLLRRLDENTADDNFLRHSFAMTVGDASWCEQREQFLLACARRDAVSATPRRRLEPDLPAVTPVSEPFRNAPDTDFGLPAARAGILEALAGGAAAPPWTVPLQIGGELRLKEPLVDGFDPSRPGLTPYRHAMATQADVEDALVCATAARHPWAAVPPAGRAELLGRVAAGLRQAREALVVALVLDAGKRVEEADAEVSEAIDFSEYYRRCGLELTGEEGVRIESTGVALVVSPWNFPLAIPAGGVFAALVTGNPVILKPATETPWVAYLLARICWDAGVPMSTLQLVIASDEVASRLVVDPRVATVILTGSTETAQLFHELRPGLRLLAETGGKNAMIVTALADRDLAIHDVVRSAFGHSGQKCSAGSLLVCEAEVYDDPDFLAALGDAAGSLAVGSAWDPGNVVTPLIHPPSGPLAEALTTLAEGERWLLEPRLDPENPRMVSPGIKLVTREGTATHLTELFGPVLGVLRATDLEDALRIANGTPYGLTASLHSLDERDQQDFLTGMQAGNLYVNRGTTGAIVGRQPFGGYKASSFGPGAKAGGPNYLASLVRFVERAPRPVASPRPLLPNVALLCARLAAWLPPHSSVRLGEAAAAYAEALADHYGRDHELGDLVGQVNVFAYRELSGLCLRVTEDAAAIDVALAFAAALTCMDRLELSVEPRAAARMPWLGEVPGARYVVEEAGALEQRLGGLVAARSGPSLERLRVLGTPEPVVIAAAGLLGIHAACEPPLLCGRWELRHYVREQSLSLDTHRAGNLAGVSLAPLGAHREKSPPDAAPAWSWSTVRVS